MKKIKKSLSVILSASMLLSNIAYAGELSDSEALSAGIINAASYGMDKISNTVANSFAIETADSEEEIETEEELFKDPGMELNKKDVQDLYRQGYELPDIEEAVKLSKELNKTPYELLQIKGKTKYIPTEIETATVSDSAAAAFSLNEADAKENYIDETTSVDAQPVYDFTVEGKSWNAVAIEANEPDVNIDENQWGFIRLSGVDKYIDQSMLSDEEKAALNSVDIDYQISRSEIATASVSTDMDFEDIYNNGIFPQSVHELSRQGEYSTSDNISVNDLTGSVIVSANDISLPGRNGLDLNLNRYYSSNDAVDADAAVHKGNGSYSNMVMDYYAVAVHPYVTITYNVPLSNGHTSESFYTDRVYIAPQRINYNHYANGSSGYFSTGMFVSEEAFNEQLQRMYDDGVVPAYMYTYASCETECKSYASSGYYDYTITMPADSKIARIEYDIEEDMIFSDKYEDCLVSIWSGAYSDITNDPVHEKYFNLGSGWSFDFPYIEKRYDSNEHVTYEYLHMGTSGIWQIEDNSLKDYYLKDLQLSTGSGTVNGESCEYILTRKDGKKYYFGPIGQLLQIKDRYDNTILFEYNKIRYGSFDYPQLKKIRDTLGRTVDIVYTTSKVTITVTDKNDSSQNRVIEYNKSTVDGQTVLSSVKDAQGYITNYEYYTNTYNVSMLNKKLTGAHSEIVYTLLSGIKHPQGLYEDIVYDSMTKNCGIGGTMQVPVCKIVATYDYDISQNEYSGSYTSIRNYAAPNGGGNKSYVYDGYPTFRGIEEVPNEYRTYSIQRHKNDKYSSDYKKIITTYSVSDNNTILRETVAVQCNDFRGRDDYSNLQATITDYTYNTSDLCTKETTRYYNDYENDKNTYVTTTKQYTYDSGKYGDLLTSTINGNTNYRTTYTYDNTYHLPLTVSYKKDAGSTIVVRYTLTTDKKSAASLTVTDNNTTKAKRDYSYDSYGNVTNEKRYIGNGNWTDYAEITYNYTDGRNVSNKLNGAFPSNITVSGLKDVDNNTIDSISKSYLYDWYGNVISETDANSKTHTYSYDKLNRLTGITNPDDSVRAYTYNVALGVNEIIETDENGNRKSVSYDNYGRVIKEKDVTNNTVLSDHSRKQINYQFAWDDVVYSTQNGKTTTRTYSNELGQVTEKQVLDASENILYHEEYDYEYAVDGMLSKVTTTIYGESEDENIKNIVYTDTYGNTVKEETVYNEGSISKSAVTEYTYDFAGNVKTVREPRASAEGWTADEYTAQYEYDAAGNVTKETDINGNSITKTYDGLGNLISVRDKNGNTTTNTYDALGRLLKEQIPFQENGTSTVYASNKYYYDGNGNITKSQKANNAVGSTDTYTTTEYEYNWQNQPTKVKGYDGTAVKSCVQYYYDSIGNVLRMYTGNINGLVINGLDSLSGTTSNYAVIKYAYDSMNRCVSQIDALGQTTSSTYDINGNLMQTTDRNGNVLSYSYDGLKRLLSKSSSKTTDDTYTYAYNIKGNRTSMTGGGVNTTSLYDNLGRLIKETLTDGTVKEYNYDMNGNRKSFKLTKDNVVQYTLTYDYDKRNQLTKVYENGTVKAEYEYNADGTLKKSSYGSRTTDYSYNLAQLLTEVNNANGSTQISKYNYTYYVDGNQKTKEESVAGTIIGTTTYTYDGLNRLKKEQAPDKTMTYTYDYYGNRSRLSVSGGESYTASYVYDKNNRLTRRTKNFGKVSDITEYLYDPNGNQISSMTITTGVTPTNRAIGIEPAGGTTNSISEYDSWNQLASTMQNGKTVSYTYNGDGMRMSKTVGGVTTSHIWDGTNVAADVTNGTVTKYIRGIQLISSKTGSNESFYNFNGHGDVVQLTNGSGSITKQYSYDAFGVEQDKTDSDTNPFRYCSEYFDSETDSIYLRARYYNPVMGRFITEDPAKDGLNWYGYCGGNPVIFVDPTGWIADEEKEMYENGQMAPGAYSFLMVCTYYYYLEDTDEGKQWWATQAQNFRKSGYTDTGNEYWNWTLTQMDSKPKVEVSKEDHFFRNQLNIEFSYNDLMKLNSRLPDDMKWTDDVAASLHQNNKLNGQDNIKYVSGCGHFEVIYNANYEIQNQYNNPADMGTYNYYSPIIDGYGHFTCDVIPYYQYGNVYNSERVIFVL